MTLPLSELRLLAWHQFVCSTCQRPAGRRCVTSGGNVTTPHAPRLALAEGWDARQPEVDQLAGRLLDLAATLEQTDAALARMTTQRDALTGDLRAAHAEITGLTEQNAALARDLAATRSERDALRKRLEQTDDPAYREGWGLPVWRDEFDKDGPPDPGKWNVRGAEMGLLEDAAVLDSSLPYIKDGILHLVAEWLDEPIPRAKSKWGITQITHRTSYLDHVARPAIRGKPGRDIFAQPYGRVEIRCKTPTGPNTRGAMPAWWDRDAGSRELDWMEAVGGGGIMPADWVKWVKDTAKTTFFSNTSTGAGKLQKRWRDEGKCQVVPHDGFHTYARTLMPDYASIEVDGAEVFRWTPATAPQIWGPNPATRPLHLRLNLHVGEHFAVPDPAHREQTQNLDFQLEYVRIYAPPAA